MESGNKESDFCRPSVDVDVFLFAVRHHIICRRADLNPDSAESVHVGARCDFDDLKREIYYSEKCCVAASEVSKNEK